MIITSTSDFREAARRRVPPFLFDYADGGAGAEATLADNVGDLSRVRLRQRVLRDVSQVDTSVSFFGQAYRMPVCLGPIGIAGMFRRRGEVLAARAACAAEIPFCLSTVSLCSLEEVAGCAPSAPWFQLYMIKDRAFMRDLMTAAHAAGCENLVFTVDMPVPGARRRDQRSGMSGPRAPLRQAWQAITSPRWFWDVAINGRPHRLGNLEPVLQGSSGMNDYMGWLGDNFDPSITWADLDWVRATWKGSLIIKGILERDDARAAIAVGADGIVVSNHGGRQLDSVRSSARALPAVAEEASGRATVFADSGVRCGLDVLRLLALGADGVFLGRAWLFALAAEGQRGVSRLLSMFEAELRTSMALAGVRCLAEIDQSLVDED